MRKSTPNKSRFLYHTACGVCSSSDGRAVHEDGSSYCHVCKTYRKLDKNFEGGSMTIQQRASPSTAGKEPYYEGEPQAVRGYSEKTAKFFGILVDDDGDIVYPYYSEGGELVKTKIRKNNKEKKQFTQTGNTRGDFLLFGMDKFGTGGKLLTIVEGQDDVAAAYELNGGFPVISVDSAATAVSDVKKHLDYIESYDKIVVAFDNDEAGREATQKVCEVLPPNKTFVASWTSYKDPNDYLINRDSQAFKRDFWNMRKYSPAGLVRFSEALPFLEYHTGLEKLPLPKSMGLLESMLGGGPARGEITVFGALTSIGKTTLVNNLVHGFLKDTKSTVSYLGLETTVGKVTNDLLSLEAGVTVKSYAEALPIYESVEWKDRLNIINHMGSFDMETLMKRLRSTIVATGSDVFILDPLQQALEDLGNDTVKLFMDNLLKIANQTNVSFVITSHMRKPDDKNPHAVSEYDLLGSSAINQVAFNTILLSRDKMHPDEYVKNSTRMQLAKCRRTGVTGEAGWLLFDKDSGRLDAGLNPYQEIGED